MQIEAISHGDADDAVWAILRPVFRAGDTYAIDTDISRVDALAYWLAEHAYLAGDGLGTYYLKRNQKGGGSHVCNCGFITATQAQGRGVARAMLEHAQDQARDLGFKAMQFNFVLASNARAVDTWLRAGFREVGRQPRAFHHPSLGYVDALILHKDL
ncbi:GNAT family N-acetyltransferase [Aliiroseovarius sp. PTFE2010]|uniref:GNAT family N-acetyltransferase n=1 Tax=Aliiroseovarius sp. PTFE2010 TaxID=3417190 RepID=UPI003CFA0273